MSVLQDIIEHYKRNNRMYPTDNEWINQTYWDDIPSVDRFEVEVSPNKPLSYAKPFKIRLTKEFAIEMIEEALKNNIISSKDILVAFSKVKGNRNE